MILVTGASGNVGSNIIIGLKAKGVPFKAALRSDDEAHRFSLSKHEWVEFDFNRPELFETALGGIERLFLMRPPAISNVKKEIRPFLMSAKSAGVKRVTFLSLLGAEKNRVVPHREIEDLIRELGIPYTFLRPSFFMQNLSTAHQDEIRELNEILVPSGSGKTSFIDVRDIAAVALLALTEPGHENRAYPLTGSEALSYYEVADILSEELGRTIVYRNPSLCKFVIHQRRKGSPWTLIGVMAAIYTVVRLGFAGTITLDLENLLQRKPISFRQFAKDYRSSWIAAD